MEPMPILNLTSFLIWAKMDIGDNHLGSCLWLGKLLFSYLNSNFFSFRFTFEFKVELYFHTSSFLCLFL